MKLACFFERLHSVLYNPTYYNKFFVEITQLQKYEKNLKRNILKGEFNIRCLAP